MPREMVRASRDRRCECGGGGGGAVPDFAGVEAAAGGSRCADQTGKGALHGVDWARDCQLTAGEEEALMGYRIWDMGYGIWEVDKG